MRLLFCFTILCLLLPSTLRADVAVLGLFSHAAMLEIDGKAQLLKQGDVAGDVKLIDANSRVATVEISGVRHLLEISQRIGSGFIENHAAKVTVFRNAQGQYRQLGKINGRQIEFLVDTGASIVALNAKHATQLGVKFRDAPKVKIATASGESFAFQVTLPLVQLGNLKAKNVKAVVLEGDFPQLALLGMSFLERVSMQESSGVMHLEAKY